jgi:hypothetical protein
VKAHLLTSAEPLTEKRDLKALCGNTVKNARFIFIFDRGFEKSGTAWLDCDSTLIFCSKCAKPGHEYQRYLYGCIEGQEVLGVVE